MFSFWTESSMEPGIRVDGHSRLTVHVLSRFALSTNSLLVADASR